MKYAILIQKISDSSTISQVPDKQLWSSTHHLSQPMLCNAGNAPRHKTVAVVVGFWSGVVSNCYLLFLAVFSRCRFFSSFFSLVAFCLWLHKEQSKNKRSNCVGTDSWTSIPWHTPPATERGQRINNFIIHNLFLQMVIWIA